jgi:hypothetical protein
VLIENSLYISLLYKYLQLTSLKMGKAANGPLGPVIGQIGNLSFYLSDGEPRVRTIGHRTGDLSPLQKRFVNKMTKAISFFNTMKPFIKAGFSNLAKDTKRNYHNEATSYNLLHAIKINAGEVYIDFNAVKLSLGQAAVPLNPTVELTDAGLRFSWTNDESLDWSASQDQVMMLAFFPEDMASTYLTSGARRAACSDVLNLVPAQRDRVMEVYMAFIADDRLSVSDSVYLGRIN